MTESTAGGASGTSAWTLMPRSGEARRVLHERAQFLASPPRPPREEATSQYVCFRLGLSERYGIAYRYLEEITRFGDVSRVPCTPPIIAGVANYRGELLTLLDLKQLFRTEQAGTCEGETQVIVVQAGGMRVGLVVDAIEGNDEYTPDSLAPPLSSGGVTNLEHVQGIHRGRVAILNVEALLADPALRVDETLE